MSGRPWARRALAGAALLAFAVWALGAATLMLKQTELVYPAAKETWGACSEMRGLGFEPRSLRHEGDEVRALVARGREREKAVLLFFHGNGETACGLSDYAHGLAQGPWETWFLELPGFAEDPLPPSQERLLANALSAWAVNRSSWRKVFAFGRSLGTGPATWLASQRKVDALILQTPFPSLNAVAGRRYPWLPVTLLNRSPFPAGRWAAQVDCPVLVLHGTADRVIPFDLGKAQAANFRAARFEAFEGADHSDMHWREPKRYWGLVNGFLKAALP